MTSQMELAALIGPEGRIKYRGNCNLCDYVGLANKSNICPSCKKIAPKPISELIEIAEKRCVESGGAVQKRDSKAEGWCQWTDNNENLIAQETASTEWKARMACAIEALTRLRKENQDG